MGGDFTIKQSMKIGIIYFWFIRRSSTIFQHTPIFMKFKKVILSAHIATKASISDTLLPATASDYVVI